MSQARVAAGTDRLPWLADEPTPPPTRGNRELAGWLTAATLLVAGVSYYMGAHSRPEPVAAREVFQPSTTVPVPQPRSAEPVQPQVALQSPPEVRQEPQPELAIPRPRAEKRAAPVAAAPVRAPDAAAHAPAAEAAPPMAQPVPLP